MILKRSSLTLYWDNIIFSFAMVRGRSPQVELIREIFLTARKRIFAIMYYRLDCGYVVSLDVKITLFITLTFNFCVIIEQNMISLPMIRLSVLAIFAKLLILHEVNAFAQIRTRMEPTSLRMSSEVETEKLDLDISKVSYLFK